jgi:hypothetical protein
VGAETKRADRLSTLGWVRSYGIPLAALAFSLLFAGTAGAEPVLKLDRHGDVHRVDDRQLPAADLPAPPRSTGVRGAGRKGSAPAPAGPSFRVALRDLLAAGQIDQVTHDRAKNAYNGVKRAYKNAAGTRKAELRSVLTEADDMSRRGFVTPTRLNALSLTLERNREWWNEGSIPRNGTRIAFEGSELVWQYYVGEGIQLQMLGNFGKLNGLTREGRRTRTRALADELVALGSERGGQLAWEYYFEFGGGQPPWTSGLSQATALQSLARATDLLGDPRYRDAAARGLGIFELPPPDGVRVDGAVGPHYLIYTFNPDLRVINAFLQSVIGLYDFAQLTGDPRAQALYSTAEAEARVETPAYNTGAWSLYSLSRESDLGYHKLTRDFLRGLCDRLGEAVYCQTAGAFTDQLSQPPAVAPLTRRIRGGKPAELRFRLSKISRVGVTVVDSSGRAVFATSAVTGFGNRSFTWSKTPVKAGLYTLRVSATDLAGNRAPVAEGPLRVLKPARKRGGSSGGKDPDGSETPAEPPISQPRG